MPGILSLGSMIDMLTGQEPALRLPELDELHLPQFMPDEAPRESRVRTPWFDPDGNPIELRSDEQLFTFQRENRLKGPRFYRAGICFWPSTVWLGLDHNLGGSGIIMTWE